MHNEPSHKPFAGLSPDLIINAIENLGAVCDGRLFALNSYENRVYQVGLEDGPPVVVKFYRPERWSDAAILEEHAFLAELAEDELPVIPPLSMGQPTTLHRFADQRFCLYPMVGGHAPELDDAASLEHMGRLLGRLHAVGALRAYQHRPQLDVASFGVESRDYLAAHALIPVEYRATWSDLAEQALDAATLAFERAGQITSLRLHGDCYAGNLLWNDAGPHILDFDDSRMGPAIQDLWMLLTGDRDERRRQLADLLAGYEMFYDFDHQELHLIEALRTLRLIHHSAWLARRWDDPAFPVAFPWFGTPVYWQDRIVELRDQLLSMEEAPLWSA